MTQHIGSVTIDVPYKFCWVHLSNPALFIDLYPHWLKSIEPLSATVCKAITRDENSIKMRLTFEKTFGIIDCESIYAEGIVERTYARLLGSEECCTLIQLAARPEEVSNEQWQARVKTIEADLHNLKQTIETDYHHQNP